MDGKTKAILIVIIGTLITGATAPVTKIGLIQIPPFTYTFIRFLISSICLLPFFLKSKILFAGRQGKPRSDLKNLILISFLPVINIALFVKGVELTTASISQLLYAGVPILTAIIGVYLLKEKLKSDKLFYIFIGLIGVLSVILLPLIEKNSLYSGNLSGNLLIILGVVVYSFYMVLSKKFQKVYSPLEITLLFVLTATVVFFILALTELSSLSGWLYRIRIQSVYSLLYISLIGTVFSYGVGQYAIKFGGPVIASLSYYLLPIVTFFSSDILLGEKLTLGLVVGTILVFISVALTTYGK